MQQEVTAERSKKIQKRVEEIKKNEEVGIRYMNAFEEKMWERREGREEGERIGEKRGKKIGERIGEKRGEKLRSTGNRSQDGGEKSRPRADQRDDWSHRAGAESAKEEELKPRIVFNSNHIF